MAREPWKCPYPDCKQECNRRWNLERHIAGQHGGDVNKSAADNEKSTWETQHMRNILKERYASHPNSSSYSLSQQDYDPLRIYGLDHRNKTAKEEKTGEFDIIDIAYGTFKKLKDRNDKIEEMRNYLSQNNAKMIIPFSSHFPLDTFNYNEHKNTLPYHVQSEFCSTPMPSSSSSPQVDDVQPKKVIGYVGDICSNCLESESLKVMYDPNTSNKIFRTQHICDPQNIDSVRRYPRPKRGSLHMSRILGLSEWVTKTVKEWTKGGGVFLIPYKIDSGNVTKNTITLNIHKNQYNWLIRAILQKHTVLNDEELNEFFFLTYNVTFCHLRINFVEKEKQQMMKQEFYFLFLNYKPCLPFQN